MEGINVLTTIHRSNRTVFELWDRQTNRRMDRSVA